MNALVTQRIIDNALKLGLGHTAGTAAEAATRAETDSMGYLDFLDHLLAEELAVRKSRRFRNALKLSALPHHKTLDEFDYSFQPQLEPRRVRDLPTLEFVSRASNVALLGPRGVGKTHIAVALAVAACQAGYSIYFTTLDDLVRKLKAADAVGRLPKQLASLMRPALLVIDEVGYLPLDRRGSQHVLPIGQPQIRKRSDDRDQQQIVHRVGIGSRRRRARHRHLGSAAAPLRRPDHQRAQLPTKGPPSPCHQTRRTGIMNTSDTDTSGRTHNDR